LVDGAKSEIKSTESRIADQISVLAELVPQIASGEPFSMVLGQERVSGTFNLTLEEEADEMIRRLTALKAFLKPAETKPS